MIDDEMVTIDKITINEKEGGDFIVETKDGERVLTVAEIKAKIFHSELEINKNTQIGKDESEKVIINFHIFDSDGSVPNYDSKMREETLPEEVENYLGEDNPPLPSLKMIGSVSLLKEEGIDEPTFLIQYSSEYAETPECDTFSLAETKKILKNIEKEEFEYNITPYLEEKEQKELSDLLFGEEEAKPSGEKQKVSKVKSRTP